MFAVDENRDSIATAQLNLPFLTDGDAGQPAHRVENGHRRARDVLAEIEHAPVETGVENLALRRYDDLVGHVGSALERQVAKVVVIVALPDQQGSLGSRITDEADAHGVAAALQAFDDEPALLVGNLAANGNTVAEHRHRRELHRGAGAASRARPATVTSSCA